MAEFSQSVGLLKDLVASWVSAEPQDEDTPDTEIIRPVSTRAGLGAAKSHKDSVAKTQDFAARYNQKVLAAIEKRAAKAKSVKEKVEKPKDTDRESRTDSKVTKKKHQSFYDAYRAKKGDKRKG